MYLGRIISAGKTEDGKPYVAYRVSSRSFPNRQVKVLEDEAAIIPKEGFETDIFKNSYIAYDCVKTVGDIAIISNGSQTNPIADKIAIGMNIRDAMAYSLITMDYEKDDYNTPRIAAVVVAGDNEEDYDCYVGIVNDKKILVEQVPFGEAVFISTYGSQSPDKVEFEAKTSTEAAKYIFDEGVFANYEKPVTSCAAIFDGEWTIDVYNP
jgi:IMP cyclohydrolase